MTERFYRERRKGIFSFVIEEKVDVKKMIIGQRLRHNCIIKRKRKRNLSQTTKIYIFDKFNYDGYFLLKRLLVKE